MKMNICMVGALLLLGVAASGCANNRDLIAKSVIPARNDVFTEGGNGAQAGRAVVDFTLLVKSNLYYLMGTYGKHTAPPYRAHLNIDGQTTILEADPILEDNNSVGLKAPESGTGWKYQFSKRLTLAPGKHRLSIALPIDDVIVEREIEIRPGINTVAVTPVYKRKMLRPYKGENFSAGVKTVEIAVN
ncbi:hypothetical protein FO488_12275 [Geobacter sp. FeAm09]|uniref:hypothetical protein n=1 Tax=Geobacter sp. FeAm09 TaxID=2597769 RepID=UPI0011EEBAB1|nr:hypothetical protein [Geobacter sp. FeAm09]QEM68854.1 hypothetical protein FO488_12275 [Geobacter sp. FeAm09]